MPPSSPQRKPVRRRSLRESGSHLLWRLRHQKAPAAGRVLVRLSGEINVSNAQRAGEHLQEALGAGPAVLEVDLKKVTLITGDGSLAFFMGLRAAQASGTRLVLTARGRSGCSAGWASPAPSNCTKGTTPDGIVGRGDRGSGRSSTGSPGQSVRPVRGAGQSRTRPLPQAGKKWTDTGRLDDERGLECRPPGDTRLVPLPPQLVSLRRERRHLRYCGRRAAVLQRTGRHRRLHHVRARVKRSP